MIFSKAFTDFWLTASVLGFVVVESSFVDYNSNTNNDNTTSSQNDNNNDMMRLGGEEELAFPREYHFSVHDFQSILTSEANEAFGTRHLSIDESNELWSNAVDYEWEKLERNKNERRRLLGQTTSEEELSPYLVCDIEYGKLGEECHLIVEEHFGAEMVTIYNDYDKSCYIVSATYSDAQSVSSSLMVTPLTAETKIREGVLEEIESKETILGLQILLCPGLDPDMAKALENVNSLIDSLHDEVDHSRRQLLSDETLELRVTHGFLRTDTDKKTRYNERQNFWKRKLKDGLESKKCNVFFSKITVDAEGFEFDAGITLNMPAEFEGWEYSGECIHSLIAGVSLSNDICSIEIKPEYVAFNAQAQWITQSNERDSRPFFDVGLNGEGQVVQVSDTGIDLDNCYFNDASNGNIAKDGRIDLSKRKVVQYVPFGDSRESNIGHGTHVSGSVAGKREGANGIVDGIAPAAKLAFFDIEVSGRPSLSVPSNPSTVLNAGRDASAKIHSASWGTPLNRYGFSERNYDSYMAFYDDFLVIIAAGNDGDSGQGSVGSPATCKNGLSVGATQNSSPHISASMRGKDYLASFSARGPTRDGRAKPDILAPGMYIRSAEARTRTVGECDNTSPDALSYKAGTSMSTPIVSGAAALVRQYFEEAWYPGGSKGSGMTMNPSSALVKAVLIGGAEAILGIQNRNGSISGSSEYDFAQRFGRINLLSSLPLSGKNTINALIEDRKPISNGQENTYNIVINQNNCEEPLSATLVWTDPSAASGCTNCLINNLDLTIDGPGGRVYPNGGTTADSRNNAERIRIENPVTNGSYQVVVRGANLDRASQFYSLVVTGCFGESENSTPETPQITPSPIPVQNPTTPATFPPIADEPVPDIPVPVPDPSMCMDGTTNSNFIVDDDVEERDCIWLQGNKEQYPWLCDYRDVALECPVTCEVCDVLEDSFSEVGNPQVFGVRPTGTTQWQGNMFDVDFRKDMIVTGFFLHVRASRAIRTARVQIYMVDGSYSGLEFSASSWGEPIFDGDLTPQGFGSLTYAELDDISINAGDKKSFYITIASANNLLIMTRSDSLGDTLVEGEDMEIFQGKAVSYAFGGTAGQAFSAYGINGGLQYTLREGVSGCSDVSETFSVNDVVGDRDCEWLAKNSQRFDYLCKFFNVAMNCPVTCNFCDALQEAI
mmetsp:Transcript_38662/g.42786  ORF Transcript_38662/g.42786 Transcript_38662/m.42786 type:complete len:1176 (-) Transcript_38662:157-3684(-)